MFRNQHLVANRKKIYKIIQVLGQQESSAKAKKRQSTRIGTMSEQKIKTEKARYLMMRGLLSSFSIVDV